MKRFHITIIFLIGVLILSACGSPAPAPTTAPTQAAAQPTGTSAPAQPSATTPGGKLISSNGVEFTIPVGLGTDATGSIIPEVLPAQNGPAGGNPAYLQFKLQGYPLSGTQDYAQVQVYDTDAYAADFAIGSINSKALKALLAAPDMPLTQAVMPRSYLLMASNMKRLSSANVKGVRMLSIHGNGLPAVANDNLTYEFQGLTTDGKFYIVVTLPMSAPFLQANLTAAVPAGGIAFPPDGTGYPAYMAQVAKLLDAAEPAGTLSPSIALMDALVQSLKLNSAGILLPKPLPTLAEQPTQTAAPTVASTPCDAAQFVSETYKDDTQVNADESFTKVWTVKNTGSCAWKNYTLVFVSGEQMGGADSTAVAATSGGGEVAPGGQIDVSLPLQAPSKKGTYTGYWTLKNGAGVSVTQANGASLPLSVKIIVAKGNGGGDGNAGAIAGTTLTFDQEQGSGAMCSKDATYFVYVGIQADGPTTAEYRVDATTASGQVVSGIFSDSGTAEVADSITIDAAGTKAINLHLVGPYVANDITIRVYVNGKAYSTVAICGG